MPDMVEAFWEDVDQKAPDEFMDRQVHGSVAIGAFGSIALPGEGDVPVCRSEAPKSRHGGPDLHRDAAAGGDIVNADQPAVGDGDPMGIA